MRYDIWDEYSSFQQISLCQRWKKIGSRDLSWLRFRLTVLLDPVPEKRQAVWQDSLLQMSGWWMVMLCDFFKWSTEGTWRMTRWFLKKFTTSSISIWGRLPCSLMFFLVGTSRPHVLLLMALRDVWVWEKKLWELPVRFVCALGNQSHTTTNTFKSIQNGARNGTCQTKPAGTLLWLQEFLIGVPWFFFGFKQLFHATNLFWHLLPLSNKVWGSPCGFYGF